MKNKKILLVSSSGGHFVQLNLLLECLKDVDIIVVSTYPKKPLTIDSLQYFSIIDFSRDDPWKIIKVFRQCIRILVNNKPDLVLTTGAAPGFVMLIAAKIINIKGIWLDSIANSKQLSLSGKLAKKFGFTVLSQWREVAVKSKVLYRGRLI
ncbi:MAG: oligosaccharide biosynthesis protein Alg14 [Desulfobacterales bacterium]|nr:MAG: oligosaccharide biosynthesis protein Alg14 [Desulfobacterales bacterium]